MTFMHILASNLPRTLQIFHEHLFELRNMRLIVFILLKLLTFFWYIFTNLESYVTICNLIKGKETSNLAGQHLHQEKLLGDTIMKFILMRWITNLS